MSQVITAAFVALPYTLGPVPDGRRTGARILAEQSVKRIDQIARELVPDKNTRREDICRGNDRKKVECRLPNFSDGCVVSLQDKIIPDEIRIERTLRRGSLLKACMPKVSFRV